MYRAQPPKAALSASSQLSWCGNLSPPARHCEPVTDVTGVVTEGNALGYNLDLLPVIANHYARRRVQNATAEGGS